METGDGFVRGDNLTAQKARVLLSLALTRTNDRLDAFLHQFDPGRLAPLIQAGVVSQEETDQLIAQRAEFLASDPFILFVFLAAGGRKPPEAVPS